MNLIPFTKSGLMEVKSKLNIQITKRPEVVKSLSRAREMGDLSENGLYRAAKFELSQIDRQIRFLNHLIKYAKIFNPTDNSTAQIGHRIIIENINEKKEYQLVGEYEADPAKNKISFKSPIGSKLIGRKANENIIITTPKGSASYKIIVIA